SCRVGRLDTCSLPMAVTRSLLAGNRGCLARGGAAPAGGEANTPRPPGACLTGGHDVAGAGGCNFTLSQPDAPAEDASPRMPGGTVRAGQHAVRGCSMSGNGPLPRPTSA